MSSEEQIHPQPSWTIDQLRAIARSLGPHQYLTWIRALAGVAIKLIRVSDVCYFRADTKYTTVATAHEQLIIRRPIKDLLVDLDPSQFWQVHRSTIVNVAAISSVCRDLAGGMVLKLKDRPERLSVSEAHRHLFRQM
jgi:DNA-binding LytR/AlgR family response regulator